MNEKDVTIGPGIRFHPGKAYGGTNQTAIYKHGPDPAKIEKRATRFVPEGSTPPYRRSPEEIRETEVEKQKLKCLPPIDANGIIWQKKAGLAPFLVNCPQLKKIARHLVDYRPSLNNPYYERLIEGLKEPKFATIAMFFVVEQGEYPESDIAKAVKFLRILAEGTEFVLPRSFLRDCASAFPKDLPR